MQYSVLAMKHFDKERKNRLKQMFRTVALEACGSENEENSNPKCLPGSTLTSCALPEDWVLLLKVMINNTST